MSLTNSVSYLPSLDTMKASASLTADAAICETCSTTNLNAAQSITIPATVTYSPAVGTFNPPEQKVSTTVPMMYFDYDFPWISFNCQPKNMELPVIKEVIFHDGTHTTIRWADDTATDVSCGEGEEYNEYEGFCAAVVKKLFGGTGAAKREMREKNLTEQRRLAKEEEAKKRQEEAEAIARKKARAKRRYIKKMAKKMLIEEEIRRQAEELAKKMNEGN